jgi:hypothetical protein
MISPTPPSPSRREGKGEGNVNLFNVFLEGLSKMHSSALDIKPHPMATI